MAALPPLHPATRTVVGWLLLLAGVLLALGILLRIGVLLYVGGLPRFWAASLLQSGMLALGLAAAAGLVRAGRQLRRQ